MGRYRRRTDKNQAPLMDILRELGFAVQDIHEVGGGCPDMFVGGNHRHKGPFIVVIEVKTKDGSLTPDEEDFFGRWYGLPAIVATKPSEILEWFGWSLEEGEEIDRAYRKRINPGN